MKKILLKNAKIVLENKLINGSILIFKNKIERIFTDKYNLSEFTFDEVIDLEGKYLGPAFIDIHIHGADGADVMDSSEEALRKISSYLVQEGTANFLATTLTSSKEILKEILKVVANLQNKDIEGANIFGVHMEGPYFSIEYKGAQNDKYMLPANIKELEEYLSVKDGLVKLFSISPHNQENLEAIKFLQNLGCSCDFFMIGTYENTSLDTQLKKIKSFKYKSKLYKVYYGEDKNKEKDIKFKFWNL